MEDAVFELVKEYTYITPNHTRYAEEVIAEGALGLVISQMVLKQLEELNLVHNPYKSEALEEDADIVDEMGENLEKTVRTALSKGTYVPKRCYVYTYTGNDGESDVKVGGEDGYKFKCESSSNYGGNYSGSGNEWRSEAVVSTVVGSLTVHVKWAVRRK